MRWNEMSARVSIITTTHNAAAHIGRMLDAIALLDWDSLECVIVDDGSTDGTVDLVRRRAAAGPRIRLLTPGRIGRARALNLGVDAAAGPLIAINDADDISLPHRLRRQMAALTDSPGSVAVGAAYVTVVEHGDMPVPLVPPDSGGRIIEFAAADFYRGNRVAHSTLLFRKSAWTEAGGYNEDLRSCIDFDFYFRMLDQGRFVYVDEPLVHVRLSPDSSFKQRSFPDYFRDYRTALATGRRLSRIPWVLRIYDLKPCWYHVRKVLLQ